MQFPLYFLGYDPYSAAIALLTKTRISNVLSYAQRKRAVCDERAQQGLVSEAIVRSAAWV